MSDESGEAPEQAAKPAKPTKKVSKKTARKTKSAAQPKGKKGRTARPFPRETLEKALSIAQALKEKNGGNPWDPDLVAQAVGLSKNGAAFFYLAAASRDYGLTTGTRDTATIELAPLGRELVYAASPQDEAEKKLQAFLSVDLFKRVLEHYRGSDLPEMKYLGNTLHSTFGLAPEEHEEFSRVFKDNCKYLGIGSGFGPAGTQPKKREGSTTAPSVVTVAEPATPSNLTAFVILPFVEREAIHPPGFFKEVLQSLLTPAARDAGFTVRTANRQGSDLIQSTIINDLIEADLVIADLTEHNPNVLFELGVRMAEDKPVVLIKAKGTGRIFDVDSMLRVFEYDPNLWRSTLDSDLPSLRDHIKGGWDIRDSTQTYMKILRKGTPD